MKLSYNLFTEPVELDMGKITFFTVENIEEYRKIIEDIFFDREEFKIYNEEDLVTDICLVENIISLDFNNKKLLKEVYKSLGEIAINEDNYSNYINSNNILYNFLCDLIFYSDYNLDLNDEIDIDKIFKAYDIKIDTSYENPLEKIIEYIDLVIELLKSEIFIIFNLGLYFSKEEIKNILKYAEQKQIIIISIERFYQNFNIGEKQILFDNDLCRVL